MITIQELLYNRGLPRDAAVKLVRHKDNRVDLYNMYRIDRQGFLDYQSTQAKPIFDGVEYVVTFIGENGKFARFIGVFKIENKRETTDNLLWYDMSEVDGFDDLKERVLIRWENGRAWHQWIRNEMDVQEILPGLNYKRFTDYYDLILTFSELHEIVEYGYTDWKIALSAIKAVYLITDNHTGKLYVGSAYGDEGLWGRWREYVQTGGHGGNKSLRALMTEDSDYAAKYFQFSILILLNKSVTADESIAKETLFKRKLGSIAFGLNNN